MYETFQETPLYKEMTRLAREKGREEGREGALKTIEEGRRKDEEECQRIEEERQGGLQDSRQVLINLVQRLFPSLATAAKKRAEAITEVSILQTMIAKMFTANTLEEAVEYLVEVPDVTKEQD